MNEQHQYRLLQEQLLSSIEALLFTCLGQRPLHIERPQPSAPRIGGEELQKALLQVVQRWNVAEAHHSATALMGATIDKASVSSALAIQRSRQADATGMSRPKRDRSFRKVMSRFPWIAEEAVSIRRQRLLAGDTRCLPELHKFVLSALLRSGVGDFDYPFTDHRSYGYRSFRDWLRHELKRASRRGQGKESWGSWA